MRRSHHRHSIRCQSCGLLRHWHRIECRWWLRRIRRFQVSVQPFEIHISQDTLDDLYLRLAMTRWPDEVQGAGWEYGTNAGYLKELVAFWQKSFAWRVQEQALNAFPHFRADIDGYGIHFIHKRSKDKHAMPIVLLHGWPSSFVQMLKILPL